MDKFLIAIDGPAASGKGTLASRLGQILGCAVLDTGLLFRYVGRAMLEKGMDPKDDAAIGAMAVRMMADMPVGALSTPNLKDSMAANGASLCAVLPSVRAALMSYQKDFAKNPPFLTMGQPARGAILDGRDIGTVICPQAPVKFYVTATPEIRAVRRVKDLNARGFDADYDAILKDIKERDHRDSTRAAAPLCAATDAHLIDTSDRSIEDMTAHAMNIIRQVYGEI